jgi:YHS domain-containing protein
MKMRDLKSIVALLTLVVFVASSGLAQTATLINLNDQGVILDGYDPVAYFNGGKAMQGTEAYTLKYDGATYYFANAENKKTFESNPEKYKVLYGGFCAYAVSQGHVSPIDPEFCVVQKDAKGNEHLICQHNKKASDLWNKNPDGLMVNAMKYWPLVVKNGGKQIPIKGVEHFYINIDGSGLANGGYDVVNYHTDNKAARGNEKFTEWFHGAKYYFTSKEHQEMFRHEPKKYLPQYGGFCAYAMSLGKVRPVNPEIFSIENGRLMLQHTEQAYQLFKKATDENIIKADDKWPSVEKRRAGKKVKFDKPAKSK